MVAQRPGPDMRRVERESRGRLSERVAALFLILHGYRILERRLKTPFGEIDIVARRGRRLAFVEVKYRRTFAEAQDALRRQQARRVARAAEHWVKRYRAYRDYEQGFDAVLVVPWRWPVLVRDAYQPVGTEGGMRS